MFKKIILILTYSLPLICSSQDLKEQNEVVVRSNGFHTGLILPVKNKLFDWNSELQISQEVQFIEFGWGNDRFYMHKGRFPVLLALNAVIHPSPTVLHVVYLNCHPEKWFRHPKEKSILLDSVNYMNLVNYIRTSFRTVENRKIYGGEGLYGPSEFYTANGKYHLFRTCNSWVAGGLKIAGQKTALLPLTAGSVMRKIK
jgi:uncharacterized protein (TIGR02117 family)